MKIKKRYLIGIIGTTMFAGFVTYATVQTIPGENLALASEQEAQGGNADASLMLDDNANKNLPVKLSGLNTFYPKKAETPVYKAPLPTKPLTVEEVPVVAIEPEVVEPEPTIPDVYYDDEEYPYNDNDSIRKYSKDSKNEYNEIENEGYDD